MKWQHTARALRRLYEAIEAIAAADSPERRTLALRRARIATQRMRQHIRNAEECEMD